MKAGEPSCVTDDESLRLRMLIDSAPALIHTARPDGYVDFFNQTWLDFVGQPQDKLLGWGWTSWIHPEDVEAFVQKRRDSIAKGERFEEEARVLRADGEYRWMIHRAISQRDADGNIVKWFGSSIDIEDRKRAEEALRQSEAYLAEAQRLSHTGSWALDVASDKYVYVSDEDLRIWGFDPKSSPTREEVFRRMLPEDRSKVEASLQKAIREKVDTEYEYRIVLPDGTVRHIHTTRHPVLNSAGDVVQLFGTSFDITDRKRAEEALRRSEAYLAEAQRLTHTGSWADDGTIRPVYWSDETYRIFGLDPQKGLPARDEPISRIHPDDREKFIQAFDRAIYQKVDTEAEYRIVLPDGTLKYAHGIGHPVLNSNGELVEIVGTVVDITERKRAEEALRESETRFRTFVDHAADAFFMLDFEQGTIIDVNRCACESLGYSRQELIGMTPLAFDVNLDRTTLESIAAQAAAGGTVIFDRHWHRRKDGSVFPVEVQTSAFWHGGRRFLLKVARDITERIRAEEAIRQSEKELRDVFEGIPAMASAIRLDGSVEFINQRWREYTGMSVEEATGSAWQSCIHPQDIDHYLEKRRAGLASGKPYEGELRIRSGASGEYRWFMSRVVPLRDERGNIVRWYAILTDIEDRKQAEERLQHENVALREEIDKSSMFEEIVGSSAALRAVLSRVAKVAPSESTVLITGETGTGKELIARAIHRRSPRSSHAFVSVNCASIPRDLIASELFGHEKGAFTGATQRHLGRFELADRGTIFLDEVGDLPAETQIALLRVLQEKEFQRVGGDRSIRSNVRVIAATNRNLQSAIDSGAFRSDLFYRLNVFPIETPPLRKRKEDIPLLVAYFIDRYTRKSGKTIKQISKRSLELLQSYPWPGNIRELQNVIERSVIVCETDIFSVDESWLSSQPSATGPKTDVGLSQMLTSEEKQAIEMALRESRGRVSGSSGAAARLGIPRSTLESRIRSLKIDKNRFKTI
jgi:formate hydrogenlyase transcriptional activator